MKAPIPIYRNEVNERAVTVELDLTRQALQAVVDAWLSLGLGDIEDLTALVMHCALTYSQAVSRDVVVPVFEGKYQVSREKWLATIDIPQPEILFAAVKYVSALKYCREPELWRIENGKVLLVPEVANKHINSQTLYASPEKMKIIHTLREVTMKFNWLNDQLGGELMDEFSPISNRFFHSKWRFHHSPGEKSSHIVLEPEFLRRISTGVNRYGDPL